MGTDSCSIHMGPSPVPLPFSCFSQLPYGTEMENIIKKQKMCYFLGFVTLFMSDFRLCYT